MSKLLSLFVALLIIKPLFICRVQLKTLYTQLLKRDGLDLIDLKNYRPVSNVPFLSLNYWRGLFKFSFRHTWTEWHSAYRCFYSTETAATKVFNDLVMAVDWGRLSVTAMRPNNVSDRNVARIGTSMRDIK